ncbi:hypothetical protein CsSME_00028291 [Camellia sinensis var. sinensis]
MGSSVEAIQAAKVYRQLLKAVKKHVDKEEKKSHFIEFISQEFRTSHEQLDLSSIHQKIKLARDYTFLLNSVHHHKVTPTFYLSCLCICIIHTHMYMHSYYVFIYEVLILSRSFKSANIEMN